MPIGILGEALAVTLLASSAGASACPPLLNDKQQRLHSSDQVELCQFAGKPLLIVNTASYCGYTGQFGGLEALWQELRDEDLIVLGFPSNDFKQEDDDEAVTAEVCFVNYGVSFTMLAPSAVSSGAVNPVFAELARQGATPPRWNFHKYVVDREGQLVAEFGSRTTPDDPALRSAIEQAIAPADTSAGE